MVLFLLDLSGLGTVVYFAFVPVVCAGDDQNVEAVLLPNLDDIVHFAEKIPFRDG